MHILKMIVLLLLAITILNALTTGSGIAQSIPLYGYVSTTVYAPSEPASTTDEQSRPPDAFAAPVAIPETSPKTFSQ